MMISWSKESVALGLEAVGRCRGPLLFELKGLLNKYHQWEKSAHYYDIIAGDWLEHFAHMTYVAMVESLAKPGSNQSSHPIPVSSDLADHASLRWKESGLHDHLREAVAELLGGGSPGAWKFSADFAQIVTGGRAGVGQTAFRFLATAKPEVLLVAPYFKCSRTEVATTLLMWRSWAAFDNLYYPIRLAAMLDRKWRMTQACSVGPASDLLSILRVLLPLHLPVVLLEGFADYRKATFAMPVARPKVVYSANGLHSHLTFKLLAAEWRDEGTRLLYHQHGGGYGIDRIHTLEDFESRVSDRYFSWGWRNADNPKIQPLSPATLNSPLKKPKHVLLNCCDFPKVVYRLHFHPMPGTIQTMHRETCTFLVKLKHRRNLVVRPYPQDYGWGFPAMMRKAAPDAEFDVCRVSAFERYAQSRLVVHNYLGTGYLETLALNIPTVCIYDIDTYAFRSEAQPLMDELERIGILHRSGAAAALFIDGLGDDPEGWWAKPDVQEARDNFVTRYANFSPDWKQHWELAFRSTIEETG
jgi:putative transferase (TIGR04331 family)